MKAGLIAFALTLAMMGAAHAQEEEIVITASRYSNYEEMTLPHVTLSKRADFVIVELTVTSDTRDLSQRMDELRQALRNLENRSKGPISLRLKDDDAGLVREFSLAAAMETLRGAGRPDTGQVEVLLRTAVSSTDTLEAIEKRISAFVQATPKPGRIELVEGDVELTLVDPEKHRPALLQQIAASGRAAVETMGDGYGASVSGLENRVAWQRSGDLDLTIFIPYDMSVTPSGVR